MFSVYGKVALVTGGASGIGLATVEQLLQNGSKGVTVADINVDLGKQVVEDLNKKHGSGKVLFVKVDVANRNEFEDAFESTITAFQNLDIVINSAGIVKDLIWEEEIGVNLTGTVSGTCLGFEKYLPKYKSGPEGVIINISSVTALDVFAYNPVYSATKAGVLALSRSYGSQPHYERNAIRVMTVCPGNTDTPIKRIHSERHLGPSFFDLMIRECAAAVPQPAEHVAKAIISMIREGRNGSVWVVENYETPHEVTLHDRQKYKL